MDNQVGFDGFQVQFCSLRSSDKPLSSLLILSLLLTSINGHHTTMATSLQRHFLDNNGHFSTMATNTKARPYNSQLIND